MIILGAIILFVIGIVGFHILASKFEGILAILSIPFGAFFISWAIILIVKQFGF